MTEEERDDSTDGIGEQLRRLLEALDGLGDESTNLAFETDAYGLNLDVDVDVSSLGESGSQPTERSRRGTPARSERSTSTDEEADYAVSVREREDGVTATVDLGPRQRRPPVAQVDGNALSLRKDGAVVASVQLPFEDGRVTETTTNNGVLVVRVDSDDDRTAESA